MYQLVSDLVCAHNSRIQCPFTCDWIARAALSASAFTAAPSAGMAVPEPSSASVPPQIGSIAILPTPVEERSVIVADSRLFVEGKAQVSSHFPSEIMVTLSRWRNRSTRVTVDPGQAWCMCGIVSIRNRTRGGSVWSDVLVFGGKGTVVPTVGDLLANIALDWLAVTPRLLGDRGWHRGRGGPELRHRFGVGFAVIVRKRNRITGVIHGRVHM